MKQVVVLSDGRPGHYNQSLAVAEALKEIEPVEVILCQIRVKRYAKYLLRMLLNHTAGQKWLQKVMNDKRIGWFYEGYDADLIPDIVISSGKGTSMLNALLGLHYGAKTLFIGNPKKLDHRLFTAVLTVLDLGFDNQIVLDVAPTLPYRGDLDAFCRENGPERNRRYHALLIGGDGSGYRYTDEEYDALIAYVNRTSKDVNWLVTTSRRTPPDVEKRMQAQMNTTMFVAYNQEPKKVIGTFLALSETVFVTEESASMVSEAVASGKSVITLKPEVLQPEENYRKILGKFEEAKRIKQVKIGELEKMRVGKDDFYSLERSSSDEIAERLKEVIHV
jgi:mitochondrial fission protein ELM1